MSGKTIKIAYVVGVHRSGSTFLGALLGAHPAITCVGELGFITRGRRGRSLEDRVCPCGEKGTDCPFWNQVWSKMGEQSVIRQPERYSAYYQAFERIRSIPRLLKELVAPSHMFRAYLQDMQKLYSTIQEVGGGEMLLDTTKSPARGLALLRVPGLELSFIHLIRDGRGVAWSKAKEVREKESFAGRLRISLQVWSATLDWVLRNLLTEPLARCSGRKNLFVRYEDLVTNAAGEMKRMGEFLELDLSDVTRRLLEGEKFSFGHAMSGNVVRLKGPVAMRPGDAWRKDLPARDRVIFWLTGGWLAKFYRY